MILLFLYFVLFAWAVVCLVVSIVRQDQDGSAVFAVLTPMSFIGLMATIQSWNLFAELVQ